MSKTPSDLIIAKLSLSMTPNVQTGCDKFGQKPSIRKEI